MKWFIVTTLLIATIVQISAAKSNEKPSRPIKKANSVKPTKYPKSLLDEFSGLTDDDTKFIKELDKQFKVHGDKVKIKLEKENTTTTKNSKRTIDGSLGYGYHQPQQLQQGFYFSQPKLMVYPYSQQDILPQRFVQHQPQGGFIPNNGGPGRYPLPQSNLHTSIRHGEQHDQRNNFGEYRGPQLFPQPQYQAQPVPVIVLRIPGPQKYANHLQALLQRYLELRAAQYISELQQQEQHNLQISATPQPQAFNGPRYLPTPPSIAQQPQRVIPVHQAPVGYVTPGPLGPIGQRPQAYSTTSASYTDDNVGVYPSQAVYEDHQIVSPQPIDNQHQIQQFQQIQQLQHFQQAQQIQHQQRQQYIQQIQQQQQLNVQRHQLQQQQQQQQQQQEEEQHEVALSANQQEQLRQEQQAAYEQSFPRDQPEEEEEEVEQEQPQQQFTYNRQQQHPSDVHDQPPINENYPSDRHTQVILPQQRVPQQYQQQVRQFSPQPHQNVQGTTPGPYNYQAPDEDQQLVYDVPVEITPKPGLIPYNFHARAIPAIPERRRDAPYSQEQFRKYTNVINRLKKKTIKPIVVQDE